MNEWQYFEILTIKLYLPIYILKAKSSILHSTKGYVKVVKSIFYSRKDKCASLTYSSKTRGSVLGNYLTCLVLDGWHFISLTYMFKPFIGFTVWDWCAPAELAYHCKPHSVVRPASKKMSNAFRTFDISMQIP